MTLNGIPQGITTKEDTKFGKSVLNKLIYGTPYTHTQTGLVERGIKTLKDYMRTILWD